MLNADVQNAQNVVKDSWLITTFGLKVIALLILLLTAGVHLGANSIKER